MNMEEMAEKLGIVSAEKLSLLGNLDKTPSGQKSLIPVRKIKAMYPIVLMGEVCPESWIQIISNNFTIF